MMYASEASASNDGHMMVSSQAFNEASQFEATQLEAFDTQTQTQNDVDSQGVTTIEDAEPMEVAEPRPFMTLVPLNRNKSNHELKSKPGDDGTVIIGEDGRYNVHSIGRNSRCDITLVVQRVSNIHAEIYCQKNVINDQSEVWILPRGQNGTWVNDVPDALPREQPRKLNSGDTLYFVNPRPARRNGNRSGISSATLDEMEQEINDNAFSILIHKNMDTRSSTVGNNEHMSLFQHVTNGSNARNHHKNNEYDTNIQGDHMNIPGVGVGQENQYSASHHQNVQHPNNRGVRFHDDCHDKKHGSNRQRNNNNNNNNNNSSSNARRNDSSDQELLAILARRRDIYDFYEITRVLGTGAYATVKLGINKRSGKHYAIKIIDTRSTVITPENMHNIKREAQILMKLKDEHIISLEDIYADDHQIFFVMELCEGGDLFDRIQSRKRPDRRYNEADARGVTRNIASGIRYLHSKKVAHRDIKPENILMTSNNNDIDIKITDFGLAKRFDVAAGTKTVCGTPQYFAPEVLSRMGTVAGQGSYSIEADMWSLGVVVYVLLSGNFPFQTNEMMAMSVARARYHFHGEEWRTVSDLAKDFIRRLLVVNPQQRMTAEEALQHPWLNNNAIDNSNGIVGGVQTVQTTAQGKVANALHNLPEQEDNANNTTKGDTNYPSMYSGANTLGSMSASSDTSPDMAASFPNGTSSNMIQMPVTPSVNDLVPPKCRCNQESIRHVTRKEGRNHGRAFFRCRKPKASQCSYFQWEDELQPDDSLREVGTAKTNHMHGPSLSRRSNRSQTSPSSQTPYIVSNSPDAFSKISGRKRETKSIVEVCKYGRGLALFGDTRPVKDHIKAEYNGKYSKYLMHPINQVEQAGWVIAKDMYETLLADTHMTVYDINSTASTNLKDSHADNSTSKENADKDVEREDIPSVQPSQASQPSATGDARPVDIEEVTTSTTTEDAYNGDSDPQSTHNVATNVDGDMDVDDEAEQEMTQPLVREQSSIMDTTPHNSPEATSHTHTVVDLVDDEEETAPLLSPGFSTPKPASPPTRKSARKKPNSAVKSGPINQYLVNKSMASSTRMVPGSGSGETVFTMNGARKQHNHGDKNGQNIKKPLRKGVLVTSNQSSAKKNKSKGSRTKMSNMNVLRILQTTKNNVNKTSTNDVTNSKTTQENGSTGAENIDESIMKRKLTRTTSGCGSRSSKKSKK